MAFADRQEYEEKRPSGVSKTNTTRYEKIEQR